MNTNTHEIHSLCRECARNIYGNRAPTSQYAERVAQLLLGTAATESHLTHRRQHGLSWESNVGAWGLWQCEAIALYDNLEYLTRRADVADRAAKFIWGPAASGQIWRYMLPTRYSASDSLMRSVVRRLYAEDRLAVVMARVHYLRVPDAIPAGLHEQAKYWKRWYNTPEGAGTPEKYINDWKRLIGGI